MFGLFKKNPDSEAQLQDFVDRLARSNSEDLGLAVATVEHTANMQFIYGDFYNPIDLMTKRSDVLSIGVLEAQRLQASRLEVLAVGWLVWVHTFRAAREPKLMPLAKSMWALLIRGAPYAKVQQKALMPQIGFELRVEEPGRIPIGFK